MSLADDIINKSQNQNKNTQGLADQIISGTYKLPTSSYNQGESLSSLNKRKKELQNQLLNYDREEKRQWWNKDDNVFENIGNVFYKTFLEKEEDRYKYDPNYENMLKEYKDLNNKIEDIEISNKEYDGYLDKLGSVMSGSLTSSFRGIETAGKKILGQEPDYELSYAEKAGNKALSESQGLEKASLNIASSLSRMLPQMIVPGGKIATAVGFANYGGSAYNQARQEGYSDSEATKYGIAIGSLEMAMTKALGSFSNVYGSSKLGNKSQTIINNVIPKIIKNKQAREVLSQMGSEGLEEFLQEYTEQIARDTLLDDKGLLKSTLDTVTDTEKFQDALYSGLLGSITSGLVSSPNLLVKNNVNLPTNKLEHNTPKKITVQEAVAQEQNSVQPTEKISLPTTKFQYEKTNNTNINNLNDSIAKYFNNSEQTKNLSDTITKIIQDKDYSVVFDDSIKNKSGNSVNAQISTKNGKTEIKINPNSPRAVEFLMVHEITHAIETDSMKSLVLDYAKKDVNFNQALENLKQTYGVDDVSSEVLADISGQLFGNQEFINNLSMQKPNIFKQIYNKIIEIANKITGNSNEALFIRDLKQKWENAYRTSEQVRQGTTYSQQQFDVSNNENLEGANKVFFNKRDNGSIYVQALDNNNKILYDFLFVGEKDIKRTLGNELGQYIFDNVETGPMKDVYIDSTNKNSETDYFMSHRPTETGAYASDISNNGELMPNDVYQHPEWYFNMNEAYSKESFNALKKIKDNPNAEITIYRATTGDKINVGDWVTLSKKYAEYHNNSQFDGKGNIVELKVKAKDVQFAGDDINEFGYYPNMEKYSKNSKTWQQYLEENYKATGTRTKFSDMKSNATEQTENNNTKTQTKKVMNLLEISKITKQDSNTTPILPKIKVSTGDGESKFASNIRNKTNMLSESSKESILSSDDVRFYEKITNQESLDKAFERLNKNGKSETENWLRKNSENATSVDAAEGWILLKQYQDKIAKETDITTKNELNRSMVEVAKKLREMGTKAGQTVQAFNILNRLTPEGMVYYAQSELSEAYEKMSQNKTKEWIDSNRDRFELTPEETKFIMDTMQEVQQMEDGYDKRVKLAEIQKLMTDKLPSERGAGIKSWMRISMLFNPKTQVRNVMGNAVIAPVNSFSDLFASVVDKQIAKKTGIRTTGKTNIKNYTKGFKTGLYQSYNDFKKGINTRNMQGNRFEVTGGKSFNDNSKIGKQLNKIDSLLSFMLDAGDRGFYEASFTNSINNQMILNNTTEVTQDMIDIATSEALSRTWQDNNNYTKFVLQTRNALNKINIKGYGLGDVLIPFAKTPANLTKAIVDYSPLGVINAINSGMSLKNSLSNGQYTSHMQHQFVQNLGKATAGTMLYILGYALAKLGITSGESDDDKDIKDFMKNTLGVSSYSIKIGNKTFTYDWAQPIAAPLSIMANIVSKQKEGATLTENIISSLDTAGNILLEQSFMESINTALSNNDGVATGIEEAILDLPARAIPTLMKQIVDLTDSTQRTSFEYDKPIQSMINSVKAKIPGISKTLSPVVDTLGREVQRYGGKNNLFNVFLNPANINTENINESAQEIYRIYKSTGDKTVMPRVIPYYFNENGIKKTLTSKERSEFQKIAGEIIEKNVSNLLNNINYVNMNDTDKSSVLNNLVNYAYNKARYEMFGTEMSNLYNKVNEWIEQGGSVSDYYANKEENDYFLLNPKKYSAMKSFDLNYKDYVKYSEKINNIKSQYDDTNSRKYAIWQYIQSQKITKVQKILLYNICGGYSISNYKDYMFNYINNQNMTKEEKQEIWQYLYE